MRKLKVVVSRTRDGVPALILAALLPAGAATCGGSAQIEGGASTTGSGGVGGQGGSGGTGVGAFGGTGGSGGADGLCGPFEYEETFVVEVPDEGVPADPGLLCAAPQDPVVSNRAALVTLNKYSQALHLATGAVTVASSLLPDVVGQPTIQVWSADYPDLMNMVVTAIESSPTGFTFQATWPDPLVVAPDEWARLIVRTTLQVQCGVGNTKQIHSDTHIHLCAESGGPQWVSSGESCTTCTQICEMAPGPLGPDDPDDDLPLAQDLRVELRTLTRAGRSRVVLAEHDGGSALVYEWHASAGQVQRLGRDVVLWTMPDRAGPHQLMVAVTGPDRAAVASMPLA